MKNRISARAVGTAAEAFVAAVFAKFDCEISVQYGANQPQYDLIAEKNGKMLMLSVKGSQDGSWGLTQNFKNKSTSYKEAIQKWLEKHSKKPIFCFVQFKDAMGLNDMPRMYLATTEEIAKRLTETRNGEGDTILYEKKYWTKKSIAAGTEDIIPDEWKLSEKRIEEIFDKFN